MHIYFVRYFIKNVQSPKRGELLEKIKSHEVTHHED